MTRVFIVLFFFILVFLGNSCRSETEEKALPTVETLAKNKNFQEISKLLLTNLNQKKDLSVLKKLTDKDTFSKQEKELLFISLGFRDINEFTLFQNKLIELNDKLSQDFDFNSVDPYQKTLTVQGAIVEMSSYNFGPEGNPFEEDYYDGGGNGDYCAERRDACKSSAQGNYIMVVSACVMGGIGIAAGTFGGAAPIGGALAGACVAGAQINYEANKKLCDIDYQECKKTK